MATKNDSLTDKIKSFFSLNESTLSTVLGALVVVVIGVLIFNYFQSSTLDEDIAPIDGEVIVVEDGEIKLVTSEDGAQVPANLPELYKVQAGDKLWDISEKYYGSGFNWVDIVEANNLINPDILLIDQELKLPQAAVRKPVIEVKLQPTIVNDAYTVQKGDHLWKIALLAYGDGYKWVDIAEANNLMDHPDYIEIGQELKLPR